MKHPLRLPLLAAISSAALAAFSSAQTSVVWQGGTGSYTDANWTVDDGLGGGPVADRNAPSFNSGAIHMTINGGTVNDFTNANTGTAASSDTILITGGAAISGDYMRPNAGATPLYLTFGSGSITMSDPNSFRTAGGSFSGQINFTGAAGSAFVRQTNITVSSTALADKVKLGFFAIDGTKITTATSFNGSNLATVNSELALKVINNKYFEVTEVGGVQTLNLLAVPGESDPTLAITAVSPGVWELTLAGEPDTRYEFRASPDLDFSPGTLVEGLVQGNPGSDPGMISGPNDEFVTTDSNGDAVVRAATLAGPKNFVRAQDAGLISLAVFDFEADGQGFIPTGEWAWGVAASDNGFANGQVTGGNGSDTGKCWGTVLGDGGPAINGGITPTTDSILTSPDIDLTGVSGARLEFAAAVDAQIGDTLEVLVRDADDDSLLDKITPFDSFPTIPAWATLDFALPATADGNTIYLEFRFQGTNSEFLGFYLDDVSITY